MFGAELLDGRCVPRFSLLIILIFVSYLTKASNCLDVNFRVVLRLIIIGNHLVRAYDDSVEFFRIKRHIDKLLFVLGLLLSFLLLLLLNLLTDYVLRFAGAFLRHDDLSILLATSHF